MNQTMLGLSAWQVFAILGVLLIIGELLVSGFVLLPIGIAFLVTALCSVFVKDWAVILTILALAEVGLFVAFKQLRRYHGKTNVYTNAEGMIGQECVVVEPVSIGEGGYVKLYGDLWPARSHSKGKMKVGDRVVITKIDGNKVIVEPINGMKE